jgi:sorbitol/mannitol transport system substrate-binding protein
MSGSTSSAAASLRSPGSCRTTSPPTSRPTFDVITVGTYKVPIWGAQGWLVPLDDLPAEYNVDDLLPPTRAGLSVDGTLYAVPFYGTAIA